MKKTATVVTGLALAGTFALGACGENKWVKRAKEIEQRACSCKDKDCFKKFMDDLKSFKSDAGKQKVSKTDADKIKKHTEAAMKCALSALKKPGKAATK